MRKPLAPALSEQAALSQGVDIGEERESDNIRFEAIDHSAGLAGRPAVGLLYGPFLAGVALVFGNELLIQILVYIPRPVCSGIRFALAAVLDKMAATIYSRSS